MVSRVNGHVEVVRGRMVRELLARPSMEYAAEVWWTGGRRACKRLSRQMKIGRRLLEASNTVAGVAVVAEKEGFVVWIANGRILVPSPPPSEKLDTAHALLLS